MWACSRCFRPELVRKGDLCWDCWRAAQARARAATSAVSSGPALAVVRARPPRHPLRPLLASCWACGGTDTLRGCIVCYRPSGGPPRGAALAVPVVEVPAQPQPQAQPQAGERAA